MQAGRDRNRQVDRVGGGGEGGGKVWKVDGWGRPADKKRHTKNK